MGKAPTILQPLEASILHAGMKLPAHIYNPRGRVLKRAGSVLSPEHVELLSAETLMVDENWRTPRPKGTTPDPVADLLDDLKARESAGDQRRYKRNRWETTIGLKVEERGDGNSVCRYWSVRTRDLSRAGFSFIFTRRLAKDSIVHTRFDELPRRPRIMGVVRNCLPLKDGTFRVGIEFIAAARGE
jgi:hypothetical protein